MASIYREFIIAAPPERVWDAVRDVGAVHRRLVPGLVTDCRLEPGGAERVVTFANGLVVRERILGLDDAHRRLAYSATGGRANHHNGSFQLFADGHGGTRAVWITDLLPDEAEAPVAALMDQGARIIAETLARGA